MFLKLKLIWKLLTSEEDTEGFRLVAAVLNQDMFDNSFLMKMLDYMPTKPVAKVVHAARKYRLVEFRVKLANVPSKGDIRKVS